MKRFLSLLLVFLLLTTARAQTAPVAAGSDPSVLIAEWGWDGSLTPLYAQNDRLPRPMASTAKIMTYCVVADMVSDFENQTVVISEKPLATLTESASRAGFQKRVGERFSCLDLLYGLMLPSGCDAAACLAYDLTGGSIDAFVKKMNAKAAELGLSDTRFADPTGLGAGNVSTVRDLTLLMRYAYGLPRFAEIVRTESYCLPGESVPMLNTNLTVNEYNGGAHYSPYALGGKTGFTNEAGRCLVSVWEKADARLIVAVMGGDTLGELSTAVRDSKRLSDWAFDEFTENLRAYIDAPLTCVSPGETTQIRFRADAGAQIEWTSDRPDVARVDAGGNVTGVARGKARVTARTQTGNRAYIDVFCGLLPGIDMTGDYADYTSGQASPVDFRAVAEAGVGFVVLNAMNGAEETKANLRGAADAGLAVVPSVTAKAENASAAKAEAKALVKRLKKEGILSSTACVSYDIYSARAAYGERSAKENAKIIAAFQKEAAKNGLKTLVFASTSLFKTAGVSGVDGAGAYLRYCPYVADFQDVPAVMGAEPRLWFYRGDGYFPLACDKSGKTRMCLWIL